MEVMVDLETASTRNNACIFVLAGIKFRRNDSHKKLEECSTFYRRINITSCEELGMHICPKTIEWWNKQEEHVKKEAFEKDNRVSIQSALKDFSAWYLNNSLRGTKIWSNGACFDIPILEDAYIRCGIQTPWNFWHVRDTRTIYDLAGLYSADLPTDNLHHALHDCHRQIWGVKESLKRIRQR